MSKRESIIATFKTELEKITVANGYDNTIKLVSRNTFKDFETIAIGKYPAIFIEIGEEIRDAITSKMYECNFAITLGVINRLKTDVSSEAILSKSIETLISDVSKRIATSMYVDRAWGDYVNKIDIIRIESYVDTNENIGGVIINTNVLYDMDFTSP